MLGDLVLITYVLTRSAVVRVRHRMEELSGGRRFAGEAGEGVISTAIAVLIVAFLGAAMWLVFSQIISDSGSKAKSQVDTIGN